jgi:uncharacterized protein
MHPHPSLPPFRGKEKNIFPSPCKGEGEGGGSPPTAGTNTVGAHPHTGLPPFRGKGQGPWRTFLLLPFIAFQLFIPTAITAPQFPALSGRVVDEAGILTPGFKSEISAQLAAHEQTTSNQLVVVTLKSLQGYDIADYANLLFRHWGIGRKGKNNGVLLIVAPNDRKMRIEVGYGLEGVLTDAESHTIIERVIKPYFKQAEYEQGIRAGVGAILTAFGGEFQAPPAPSVAGDNGDGLYGLLVAGLMIGQFVFGAMARRASTGTRALIGAGFGALAGALAWIVLGVAFIAIGIALFVFLFMLMAGGRMGSGGSGYGNWSSGGSWGGGGGGGGFSGGGGSSGGGGASGSW